ncbi:MAG: AAA family ATPase [Nitriliruptorales bacterium]
MPPQLTAFIGRAEEIVRTRELLDGHRLVTLTGPGGTGKTRLGLQVAAEALADFSDGVFFVDLSAVTLPELVATAIAGALGVREEAGRPMLDTLRDHLRDQELLLVLDNFEQVTGAGPSVLEPLLRAAPGVKALVTSRAPLHLYGEQQFPVPPLALADPRHLPGLEALARFESVALFAERAVAAKPDFRLTATTRSRWQRSLFDSTGCPSPSNSLQASSSLCHPRRCWHASSSVCRCLPPRIATCRSGSAPCVARSSGPTSCSTSRSGACSRV